MTIVAPWLGDNGVRISSKATSVEAVLAEAGLSWKVQKSDELHFDYGSKTYTIPGRSAIFRTPPVVPLDPVSDGYMITQNEEAFRFFRDILPTGRISWAGSIRNGQAVWAIGGVTDHDHFQTAFHFTNPHQYGKTISIRPMIIMTDLWTHLLSDHVYVIKRTREGKHGPEHLYLTVDVQEVRASVARWGEQFQSMSFFLKSKRYEDGSLKDYLTKTVKAGKVGVVLPLLQAHPTHAPGTWFQAFEVVCYVLDHVLGRSQETRLDAAFYGQIRKRKLKALALAMRYAENFG